MFIARGMDANAHQSPSGATCTGVKREEAGDLPRFLTCAAITIYSDREQLDKKEPQATFPFFLRITYYASYTIFHYD